LKPVPMGLFVVAFLLLSSVVVRSQQYDEAYVRHRSTVEARLGSYRVYVYGGPLIDAVTKDVVSRATCHGESAAEVWVHRALLASPRRTLDPAEAEVFFVPAYLSLLRRHHNSEGQKLAKALANVTSSEWFARHEGRDHVFGYSATNPEEARHLRLPEVTASLPRSFRGAFEVNPSWVAAPATVSAKSKIIAMPYVVKVENVNNASSKSERAPEENETISVFFAASERPHAVEWSQCDRTKALPLTRLPRASVQLNRGRRRRLWGRRRQRRRLAMTHEEFAKTMARARYCLVMCGDTPTSRRIFDAVVAGCVPLIVGTRLEGRCEPPCHAGWGWHVSGPDFPHTPFSDLYVDYAVFPRVDEALFSRSAVAAVRPVLQLDDRRHAALRDYLMAIRDDFIYGVGSCVSSTHFGRAAANLIDTAVLRWRATQQQHAAGFPDDRAAPVPEDLRPHFAEEEAPPLSP